jgi:glycosyltransferase involved in cell wall biosynthesis
MTSPPPKLSIVIPAYNEEKRLSQTLERIRTHFAMCPAGLGLNDIEVIVVDDGSLDGTAEILQKYSSRIAALRLICNDINRGKGYSVRRGMSEAQGCIALFSDADLSSPIEESGKLIAAIEAGSDVAIGSRALDRSLIEKHQSQIREIAGIVFNGFVRLLTGLPFRDTQCGFKAFARERCQIIFEQQRIERFGFDPEILFLARWHGLNTVEVPVRWSHDPATKVHVVRDGVRMFWNLFCIRWNWMLDRYPRSSVEPQHSHQQAI